VVLVCPPVLVAESLAAMDRRPSSDTAGLVSLMGRGGMGWDGLLAEARYDGSRTALSGPDFAVS
jgi:beta-N-acetylhexosaminidase